jgi:hypothetical protein
MTETEVKWRSWVGAIAAMKPDCLFCHRQATDCAYIAREGSTVAIRACTRTICRAKAEKFARELDAFDAPPEGS